MSNIVTVQPNLVAFPGPHQTFTTGTIQSRIAIQGFPPPRGFHFASFPTSGGNPGWFTFDIQGRNGMANYTGPALAAIEYYDSTLNSVVREWQYIGSSQGVSRIHVLAGGSADGNPDAIGAINIAIFPVSLNIPGIPGIAARAAAWFALPDTAKRLAFLDDAIDGVFINSSFTISLQEVRPASSEDIARRQNNPNLAEPGGRVAGRTIVHSGVPPLAPLCFAAGTMIDMWDGTRKPIEQIRPGDWVVSFDENDPDPKTARKPGLVTRTFENYTKVFLDLHGVKTTPGHAFRWGDGPRGHLFAPIIDILRRDGAMVDRDGNLIRAATNCRVGSLEDGFIWAVTGPMSHEGFVRVREKSRIRLGTRFILPDGAEWSVLETIRANGWVITDDGLLKHTPADTHGFPYYWTWTDRLPRPEDYVLQRSGVTLEEIYEAGEWEAAERAMRSAGPPVRVDHAASSPTQASPPPTAAAGSGPASLPKLSRAQRRAAELAARRARRKFRGEPTH